MTKRTWSLFAVAVFGGLLLASTSTRSQEAKPPTEFRSETTLVVVDAIVTDKKGHVVTGLDASAFKILENGVEQKIVNFSAPTLTAGATEAPAGAPHVSTATTKPSFPQFITVVLDLSDNRPMNIKRSCDAVLQHLRKVTTEHPQVAIYYIEHGLHLALPFTADYEQASNTLDALERRASRGTITGTDRRAIQEQIDELYLLAHPEAMSASGTAQLGPSEGSRSGPSNPFAQAYMREINTLRGFLSLANTFQVRDIMVALRSIALAYRDLPGRKNVIVFSEGFPYASGANPQMDALIATADQANVSFYVIDPSGLDTGAGIERRGITALNSQMNEISEQGIGDTMGGESKFDRMKVLGDKSLTDQLDLLATSTGGFLVKNTNDLQPAFTRIINETNSFYVMTFRPSNPVADGTFRTLRVQVAGDGLQIRHRKGYWAIPQGRGVMMSPAGAQLLASVNTGTVRSSLSPAMQATVMLAPDGSYYVPISYSVPAQLAVGANEKSPPLNVIAVGRDRDGRIVTSYEKEWRLVAEAAERKGNITFQGQLPFSDQIATVDLLLRIPDGRYGAASAKLRMPTTGSPQLSDIVLATEMEQAECPDHAEALCIGNARFHQPATPALSEGGRLIAVVAASGLALDAQTKKPRVGAVFNVKQGGKALGSIPEKNVQAIPGIRPDTVWFVAQLSLKSLPTGNYTLEVVTKDFGGDTSASNATAFDIR